MKAKTSGAFRHRAVHCINLWYLCQKQKPRLLPWFFVFGNKWIMGFERPLRKHAGGMFLGRGRIPGKPTASRKGCWRLSIFWCIQPKRCALYQHTFSPGKKWRRIPLSPRRSKIRSCLRQADAPDILFLLFCCTCSSHVNCDIASLHNLFYPVFRRTSLSTEGPSPN